MNRFSKILAIVLLLALLTSVLGIFSVFAEDATEHAPKVIYDMDSKNTLTFKEIKNSKPTMVKKTDDNGEDYWLIETGVENGSAIGTGNEPWLSASPTSKPVLRSGGSAGDKDTDFMVIDLDLASDDEFIEYIYFNMRYYGKSGDKPSNTGFHPYFYANGYEDMYVKGKSTLYPTVDSDNEWVNMTIVYDFRTETPSNWMAYVYIDGYYAGSMAPCTTNAYQFYEVRFTISKTATADYQTTKIRNLTYTAYPVEWDGDLAASGMLGQYGVTLNDIDELAYCLEGTNAKRNDVIATITRGAETIDVKSFEDLDANFVSGDVVDLKADIGTPILVNAENVTINANGYTYHRVDTSSVDFSTAKYVVLKRATREVTASGDETTFSTMELTNGTVIVMLDDMAYTGTDKYMHSRHVTFDLNGYTITFSGSGRPFNAARGANGLLKFANGKFNYSKTTDLSMINYNDAFVFDNVDMTLTGGNGGSFIDQRHGLVLVNDCKLEMPAYGAKQNEYSQLSNLKGSVSRRSAVCIVDSEVVCGSNGVLTASNYASGGLRVAGLNAKVYVKGSNITSTGGSPFTFDAYGDQTLTIDEEGVVNGSGANSFDVDLSVIDSVVNTNYRLFDVNLATLTWSKATTTYNAIDSNGDGTPDKKATVTLETPYKSDDMDIDVDVNIIGSDITCSSVVDQSKGAPESSAKVTFKFDVAVNADGNTKIAAAQGIMWNESADEAVTSSLTLANGVKATRALLTRTSSAQGIDTVTLGNGSSKLAYTTLADGYNCVVTPDYREIPYVINDHKGENAVKADVIYWNGTEETDPADINKAMKLPAANTTYKYTGWTNVGGVYTTKIVPNFTLAANLNALTDFDLNVYLTATDASKLTVTVNGNTVTDFQAITIDGVDYIKAEDQVIKGITPEMAETTYPVVVSFTGGFGEKVVLTADVSVAEHLIKALAGENEKGVAFAQSIINYVVAANAYDSKTVESLAPYATTVAAPAYTNAKWEALAGVSAKLNLGDSVRWVFTATAGKTYTITYAGKTINATADEKGEIVIGMRAVSLTGDITIACDGQSATVNLAGYHGALAGNAAAQAVVNALYNYSEAAQAYAAVK